MTQLDGRLIIMCWKFGIWQIHASDTFIFLWFDSICLNLNIYSTNALCQYTLLNPGIEANQLTEFHFITIISDCFMCG